MAREEASLGEWVERTRFDPCKNCGKSQSDRPAIFKGEDWCSDLCRKALQPRGEEEEIGA